MQKVAINGENEQEIKVLQEQIESISAATTLEVLGLSFQQAVQILEENNMPVILGEEDKTITQRGGSFEGVEDFILVHETRFPPKQGKIKSPKEANGKQGYSINLDGKDYEYEIPYLRDTVHFTVNNEVNTSHGYLDCDDCKYAVLIPMKDVIEKQEMKGEAADLYTVNGGPEISENSYIFCPIGEGERLRKENPGVTIVEHEGESVRGYPQAFLTTIGYRQSSTGAHEFLDDRDSEQFVEIMKENKIQASPHFHSSEKADELALMVFEREISIYKIIKENGLIQSEADLSRITEQLTKNKIIDELHHNMSQQQKEYFLKRMEEEDLDFTALLDTDKWQEGTFIREALAHSLVEEKINPRIEQTKTDLALWQEACRTRRRSTRYFSRRNL